MISLLLCEHPETVQFLVFLTGLGRSIPLWHLLARRLSSERVCTFISTPFALKFSMNVLQLFAVSKSISTEHGQESRTHYESPHKWHGRVESSRRILRPAFISLFCFFTGSTFFVANYSHILSLADTPFEPDISWLKLSINCLLQSYLYHKKLLPSWTDYHCYPSSPDKLDVASAFKSNEFELG